MGGFCRSTVSMKPLSDCGKSVTFSTMLHRPERRMSRPPTDETSGGNPIGALSLAKTRTDDGRSGAAAVEELVASPFEPNKRGKRDRDSCLRLVGWGSSWSRGSVRSGQGDAVCSLRRSKSGDRPCSGESSWLEISRSGLEISISKLGVSSSGFRPVIGGEDSAYAKPMTSACVCMCVCM